VSGRDLRKPHVARLLGACLAFVALLLMGCQRGDVVAELEKVQGAVSRDLARSVGNWEAASAGADFRVGDGVRSGPASRALLRLFDRSALELEPKTVLRFREKSKGGKGAKLDVEMGQATLEAAGEALEFEMSMGSARLEANGKLRLTRSGDGTRLEVLIGSARILSAEDALELRVGDAVDIVKTGIERVTVASASSALPPAPSQAPPEPAASVAAAVGSTAPAAADSRPEGPGVVDLVAGAGDSFVIHDPKPPTSIAFLNAGCDGELVLTLDPGKRPRETGGRGRVSAEIAPGSHRYVVSCVKPGESKGTRVADGNVVVIADAGARRLARTAPASVVDTDGRRYTVLYQTLLPNVSVRWPNAPTSGSYTLRVSSSSGARSLTSSKPSYSFGAGMLGEGDHTLSFEGGGARSKPTSVAIRFDNAAPTASISSPQDRSFAPGASVVVSGYALPGWTVSSVGKDLTQDTQNRFSGEVSAPVAERALAIRFSHPSRGNHYYLRRSVH
jgi:hypothetical protein